MATVNQLMPRSGQPKRFSFHIDTNDRATKITPRNIRSDPGLTTCLWLIYAMRNIGPLISYQRFRLWGQESADSYPQAEHHPNAIQVRVKPKASVSSLEESSNGLARSTQGASHRWQSKRRVGSSGCEALQVP